MAFGLTMGTERAAALQNAIQAELMKRQDSTEAGESAHTQIVPHKTQWTQDPVMAEYITIMVINNKTSGEHYSFARSSRIVAPWVCHELRSSIARPVSELALTLL